MTSEYVLVNIHKPEDRTYEVEEIINELAGEGWEVVGYSAHGFRGVAQAGFSHFVLLEREETDGGEDVVRCPRCRVTHDVPDRGGRVKCDVCDYGFIVK